MKKMIIIGILALLLVGCESMNKGEATESLKDEPILKESEKPEEAVDFELEADKEIESKEPFVEPEPAENNEESEKEAEIYHVIEKGETLYAIGKKYGVPWSEIVRANESIKDANVIKVGQKLLIPRVEDK